LGSAAHFVFFLAGLLLSLESFGSMRIAETMHVNGLYADTRAAVAALTRANTVSSILFALAPLIKSEIPTAHVGYSVEKLQLVDLIWNMLWMEPGEWNVVL
jgi:hypothetical protein